MGADENGMGWFRSRSNLVRMSSMASAWMHHDSAESASSPLAPSATLSSQDDRPAHLRSPSFLTKWNSTARLSGASKVKRPSASALRVVASRDITS